MRFFVLGVVTALSLTACGKEVLDFRNAEVSGSKIYEASSNQPFSGQVTNVPIANVPLPSLGPLIKLAVASTKDEAISNLLIASSLGGAAVVCDVEAEDGKVSGDVNCKTPANDSPVLEVTEDHLRIFNPKAEGQVLAEVGLKDGTLSGASKVYGPKGKVVNEASWENGVISGSSVWYDENTGNVTDRGSYLNGTIDGESLHFAEDGKTILARRTYKQGVLDGPYEEYDAKTHALIKKTVYKDGVDLAETAQPSEGQAPETEAQAESEHDQSEALYQANSQCVDRWNEAYRKEAGEDAMVSSDQMDEWAQWCSEGKEAPRS